MGGNLTARHVQFCQTLSTPMHCAHRYFAYRAVCLPCTAQISQIFKLETKGKSTGTLLVCNLNKCLCHASSTNMDTIVDGLIVYKVANKHCTPSMYILGDYLEIISIAYNYS